MPARINLALRYKVNNYTEGMLIGDLAEKTGVPRQTIRFYERQGLLPSPQRRTNGYRHYSDAAITRLQFIKAAQAAGLTLVDIRSVIGLRDAGETTCTHVSTLLEHKLESVRVRQRELAALEAELDQLLDHSRRLDPEGCSDDQGICHILLR